MDTNIYKIIFTNTAKDELENIYEYIYKNLLNPISANNLMNKIELNILRLELYPYSCSEIHVKSHNKFYRKLVINNYIVLYQVFEKSKQVSICHIFYGKQNYLYNL